MIQLGILLSLALIMLTQARRAGRSGVGFLLLLVVLWFMGGMIGDLLSAIMIRGLYNPDSPSPLLLIVLLFPIVGSMLGAMAAFLPLTGKHPEQRSGARQAGMNSSVPLRRVH